MKHPPSAPPESALPPRAVPTWVYAHPELARLEYERMAARRSRQFHSTRRGDMTLDFGRDSVFAVRTSEGDIRGFHNLCRQRGAAHGRLGPLPGDYHLP